MSVCTLCGAKTNQPICAKCLRGVLLDLNELSHLLTRLESVARREDHSEHAEGHVRQPFAPTLVDLSAMDLLQDTVNQLEDIAANSGIWQHSRTWRTLLKSLITRKSQLANDPHIHGDRERITRMVDRVRFRLTPPSERIIIGPCLNSACGTILLVTREQTEVTCHNCGSMWQVEAVRKRRREELAHETITLTPADAAAWVRANTGIYVTRKAINMWAQRQRVAHKPNGDGTHEYNKADLLRLAETLNPKHW